MSLPVPPHVPLPSPGLAHATILASAWTIATGLGMRVLGVVGTLVLTYFVAPAEYGEVSAAAVIVLTANQFSTVSVGTYVLAHPGAGRAEMFHATVLHVGLGFVVLAALLLVGARLGPVFDAPNLGRYLPGLILSLAIDRVTFMPERVLVRGMRFGRLSIARALSELAYTAGSVITAVAEWGGMAVVAGNLARSTVRLALVGGGVRWREWLEPARLRLATLWRMIRFGVPVTLGGFGDLAIRRWDSLIVSRSFGPLVMGEYALARSLADVPAVQVGEQISDVLQAAFARIEGGDRRRALVRSLRLLAFIMAPLAVGLACVASTLASAFLGSRWAGVGVMLMILSLVSFTRPISYTIGAYLQLRHRQRVSAVMDLVTAGLVLGALATVGRASPTWACLSVTLVFSVCLLAWAGVLRAVEGVPVPDFLALLARPLAACAPMVAAVAAVHHALPALGHAANVVTLVVEMAAGAAAFALGAWLVARPQVLELAGLVRRTLSRRAARA